MELLLQILLLILIADLLNSYTSKDWLAPIGNGFIISIKGNTANNELTAILLYYYKFITHEGAVNH